MAAPTTTDRRVAIGLDALERALDDLPEVGREWAAMDDGERASWSLDWDHLMATYLRLIDGHYRSGALIPDQCVRYGAVISRLKQASPLIERLQLYPPAISVDS